MRLITRSPEKLIWEFSKRAADEVVRLDAMRKRRFGIKGPLDICVGFHDRRTDVTTAANYYDFGMMVGQDRVMLFRAL